MTTVDAYIERVEQSDLSDAALERISQDIVADTQLTELEVEFLGAWIGNYLADNDREREPVGGWDPDNAPEEGPSLVQRRRLALRTGAL